MAVFIFALPLNTYGQASGDACYDASGHAVELIDVSSGVSIEALDWGGDGYPLIFVPGFGNTAHIFDDFAFHFTPEYRVISITRRGFGKSSWPSEGYDTATRAADVIGVMDHLEIDSGIIVGHSIAGDVLSYLGANYKNRFGGMVYLDAYDYGDKTLDSIEDRMDALVPKAPPSFSVPSTKRDSSSVHHWRAYLEKSEGNSYPLAEICSRHKVDSMGMITAFNFSLEDAVPQTLSGTHEAEFEKISIPTLGIFAPLSKIWSEKDLSAMSDENRTEAGEIEHAFESWQADQWGRFQSRLPNSRFELLENADHYVFISNARETVQLMAEFAEEINDSK